MQSLDEFHAGVRQSQVQAQVSRVFFEPHVLVLCLCLLLWDFTWILLPSMACQWHTQAPSSLCQLGVSTHPFQPHHPEPGGKGTATRLCKEWLGNDTKSHYPQVKYCNFFVECRQGLDSSRRNGGYSLLEILKFWESCKIFHELKILFVHFY